MEIIKNLSKKKQLILAGSLILIVAIAGISAFVIKKDSSKSDNKDKTTETEEKKTTKIGAEITYLEGQTEYKEKNGGWFAAKKDSSLKEGDSIRTISNAKAILTIDDGSVVRLDKDSEITLVSLDPKNIIVSNDKGNVYSRVAKAERTFTIKSGSTEYKSLGTAYKTVNTEKKKGVEVYHSKVEVNNTNEKTIIEQGNKYYLQNTDDKSVEKKKSAITSEELNKDEFVKWNKEEDSKIAEYKEELGIMEDTTGPVLEISSPVDGTTTTDSMTTVTGTTEVDAKVFVNDIEVTNNEGAFSSDVELQIGANKIKVVSKDLSGNQTTKELNVVREEIIPTPTETPVEPTQEPTSGIYLSGSTVDNGIAINWTVTNLNTEKGFKVVKSVENSAPTYPNDSPTYLDGNARSYVLEVKDGQTYFIRVCTYTGDGCDNYSNAIQVTAPTKPEEPGHSVSSISLSSSGGKSVAWSTEGYASQGFKLIWSKNPGPTYPTRSGDNAEYHSNPNSNSGSIYPSSGSGTYYVRVCAYKDGACNVYSNEISIEVIKE